MYRIAFFFFLIVFSINNVIARNDGISNKKRAQIKAYFEALRNGSLRPIVPDCTLGYSNIQKYRNEVWKLWTEVNTAEENNLFECIRPLEKSDTISWLIPDSLELHARMTSYVGTKGDIAEKKWPLFLYLHGSGPKAQEWATGLKLCQRFDDAPSVYFIPRIPNEGEYYRWWQRGKQYIWEKLLRQTMMSGKIDPNRLYVFGISEGGYGSQRLASYYADYWAAAGPMAGGEPLINAPVENCGNIGFSLLTGSKDDGFYRNRLTTYTHEAFDSLEKVYNEGFVHRIELIPGAGHGIDYSTTTPWLKEFERNPYPKFFVWENFDMDGRYRDGFYNLQIVERSDTSLGSRTRYIMKIEHNTVYLSVDVVTYQTSEMDSIWGIPLKFNKSYQKAQLGKLILYLSDNLVNLEKPVRIILNDKVVYNGKLKANLHSLINSCTLFSDPYRLYPVSVEVDIEELCHKKE